jgi:hypothetical protein
MICIFPYASVATGISFQRDNNSEKQNYKHITLIQGYFMFMRL